VDAADEPVSKLRRLIRRAEFVRDLEVDVLARAIAEVFEDG